MFSVVGGDFGKLGWIGKIVLRIPDAVRLRAMFLYDSGISRLDLYHSDGLRSQHGGVGLDMVKGKHKCHSHILKDLMILTDDSSRSALTCIPPVTREMVSFPERSVTWTKVSLNLCSTSAIRQLCLLAFLDQGTRLTRRRCEQHRTPIRRRTGGRGW